MYDPNLPDPVLHSEPLTVGECAALALPFAGLLILLIVTLAS
jgi:hypothetical protein